MTISVSKDVVNQLAGVADDSAIGQLRISRDVAFNATQGSFHALLEPDQFDGVSQFEREAIAYRVAVLEHSQPVIDLHLERLLALGVSETTIHAIAGFPEAGDLSARLPAILRHTDLLTNAPQSATAEDIAALKRAGLSTKDIVTISQLIAFVSYEVRLLATLRILKEQPT